MLRGVVQSGQGLARSRFLRVVVDPHLGLSLHEWHFAQRTSGVGVEDVGGDAEAGQRIGGQLGVKQGGSNVNPFH